MLSKDPINVQKFKDGGYNPDELSSMIDSLQSIELQKELFSY